MDFIIPPPEVIPYGLRALKVVAMSDGTFGDRERALLDAAQSIFGSAHDVDALAPISPSELAEHVTEPALRQQLVFAMLTMSLVDGEASAAEATIVADFRDALGVESHDVDTFRKLADGQFMQARLDVARRFWAVPHMRAKIKEGGLKWLVRTAAAALRLHDDTVLADKYRALADYPEGSLGREYYDFIRGNEFSLPGEKGSPPEFMVIHDLTHVLSGYGTTPPGELCVTAFHAGYRQQNPFTWILFSMMQFNLGIRVTPLAEAASLQIDPPRMLEAFRRGTEMNADISDGSWDYWSDLKLPIGEVRAKFNIVPLADA